MKRILAIDYGRKRIGVALSDPLGYGSLPLDYIDTTRTQKPLQTLRILIEERGVHHVLVGHPISMNGTPGPMAHEARAFKEALEKLLTVPVELVDERLSSKEAERTLIAADVRRDKRKQHIDSMAAAIFLQTYLDLHRAPSSPSDLDEEI